jgi:hypothetical protein
MTPAQWRPKVRFPTNKTVVTTDLCLIKVAPRRFSKPPPNGHSPLTPSRGSTLSSALCGFRHYYAALVLSLPYEDFSVGYGRFIGPFSATFPLILPTSSRGNNTGTISVSHCLKRYRMLLKQLVSPWFSVAYFPVTAEVAKNDSVLNPKGLRDYYLSVLPTCYQFRNI